MERRVLVGIVLVLICQFINDSPTQHAGTFAMNEDEFLALVAGLLLNRVAENLQLVFQDVSGVHSCCRVKNLLGMQVDNDGIV